MSMLGQLERLEPDDSVTFNVRTSKGFTEMFDYQQVDVLCRLGLIRYDKTTFFPEGKAVHFYKSVDVE